MPSWGQEYQGGEHETPALEAPAPFLDAARALGIEFEPGDVERLGKFLGFMLATNKTHNLTAITDPGEAWMRHILDALTLIPLVASLSEQRPKGSSGPFSLVDVGSGGGVPGIPLAIVMPEVSITLVEATGKKVAFLKDAARLLGLKNVRVIQSRAEGFGQRYRADDPEAGRERFDAATARALGHLAVVSELTVPLLRIGGCVLAVKGAKAEQEVEESKEAFVALGARFVEIVETPTGRVVVLEKVRGTSRMYPRKDGEPKRVPIGGGGKAATPPEADGS